MSNKSESIEGREQVLRRELTAAHAIRDLAEAKLLKAKSLMERGNSRFEQAKSEFEALQSSREAYKKRCIEDSAFALLTSIESDTPPQYSGASEVVISPCRELIEAAEMKLDAHKTALAKLNSDLDSAREAEGRAVAAVSQLIAGITGNHPGTPRQCRYRGA